MIDPIMAAFELANHLGVRNMKDMTTCWEVQVDDAWWLALNPTPNDITCSKDFTPPLPPFSLYVEYNGFPAGVMMLAGDGEFAAGTEANAEAFAAAIAKRIAQ